MREIYVVGAAIIEDGRCLVAQRGPGMKLAGKWEFPGGKIEVGEDPRMALAREIKEELGLEIKVLDCIGRGTAKVGDVLIVLDVYAAQQEGGTLALAEHSAVMWHDETTLDTLDWADADIPVLGAVRQRMRG